MVAVLLCGLVTSEAQATNPQFTLYTHPGVAGHVRANYAALGEYDITTRSQLSGGVFGKSAATNGATVFWPVPRVETNGVSALAPRFVIAYYVDASTTKDLSCRFRSGKFQGTVYVQDDVTWTSSGASTSLQGVAFSTTGGLLSAPDSTWMDCTLWSGVGVYSIASYHY